MGSDDAPKVNRIEVIVDQKGGYSLNGQALINSQSETLLRAIEKLAISDKNAFCSDCRCQRTLPGGGDGDGSGR